MVEGGIITKTISTECRVPAAQQQYLVMPNGKSKRWEWERRTSCFTSHERVAVDRSGLTSSVEKRLLRDDY